MSERSIVRHSKCRVRQGPWVRIPLSPPRRKPEPLVGSGFCVVWSKDAGIRTRKGATVKLDSPVSCRVRSGSRRPSGEPQNGRLPKAICVNPTCQLKENAERRDENPKGPQREARMFSEHSSSCVFKATVRGAAERHIAEGNMRKSHSLIS